MYETLTVEDIKDGILGKVSAVIDMREGSFTNDLISAIAYEIWKTYQSLDALIPMVYVDETSGIYIDKRCSEYGIKRKEGTKATTTLSFIGTDGTVVPEGKILLTSDGLEFETDKKVTIIDGKGSVTATAVEVGESYNVEANTIMMQFVNLTGLSSISNSAATGGTNPETDAALVARLYSYLQKPATAGNNAHYRQWALEVNGVGNAKVTPLWNGPGTVRVLIVGNNNEPAEPTIVTNCLTHIEENRPVGAAVTVASAEGLEIDVEATVIIDSSTTIDTVQNTFKNVLENHLRSISFKSYEVVYNRIAYMLLDIDGVVDYNSLALNGGLSNIIISDEQVPICGTVVIL